MKAILITRFPGPGELCYSFFGMYANGQCLTDKDEELKYLYLVKVCCEKFMKIDLFFSVMGQTCNRYLHS